MSVARPKIVNHQVWATTMSFLFWQSFILGNIEKELHETFEQRRANVVEHQLRSRKETYMSNFPTPLEEVIHHNVIKNNKTGGPALDVGQMQLLWRALERTRATPSPFLR
jgi:hypothetical protein